MSGIYKSRLFNFLNRQKIRFSNQLGITFRHLQLAAETGVQILLYPVYVITRTSISARQQLGSDSQTSASQVNISREKSLKENDLWLSEEDNNLATNISKSDYLATLADNQKATSRLTRQGQGRVKAIAPVRFFQKMLDWVKTSPVATKLNLFGEANIVPAAPERSLTDASVNSLNSSLSVKETTSQPDKKSFISNLFNYLGFSSSKRTSIANTESSEKESFAIQVLIRNAIAYFFGKKQQLLSGQNQEALPSAKAPKSLTPQLSSDNFFVVNYAQKQKPKSSLFSKLDSWLNKPRVADLHDKSLMKISSTEDSLSIQILIRRAIAYFFGNKQTKITNQLQGFSDPTLPLFSSNLTVESKKTSFALPFNNWNLKLSDVTVSNLYLLGYSLFQDNNSSIVQSNFTELDTSDINIELKEFLSVNNASSKTTQNPSCIVVTANFPPTSISGEKSITVADNFNDSLLVNIPLEFSSDLWEAEVITVGYAKNILEIILEFLDKITWRFEKYLVKLWQFFQKIFRRLIIVDR